MKDLLTHYWYIGAIFSAIYTIGSAIWTWRVERRLRKLRAEQAVLNWVYQDMRRELDDVQAFLENGNTLRDIKVIPLRKRCSEGKCRLVT